MPWEITAKKMAYRDEDEVYEAEGDVVISKGSLSLYAQKATYNMKTGIAKVSGDVRFEAGGDLLTGEQAIFDIKNQTGKITNGNLFLRDNNFYVKGGIMEKMAGATYLIKDCHLTTCDGIDPAWSITGSEIKVTIEGYGKVKHAALRVRGVPILYVPYMIFPAKTKRQTGLLLPSLSNSSRNGVDAELPFFWAISDQTDATLYQRLMGKRGYMQGLEFRYIADENSIGVFMFDILSDREKKDLNDPDDVEISPLPRTNRTRYWFRSRMDQDMPLGLAARLDADYLSDQDYLNEFESGGFGLDSRPDLVEESDRPFEEKRSPTRRSALRVSRDAGSYSLQALASYHQLPKYEAYEDYENHPLKDKAAQPLGGLSFILLPGQIRNLPIFLDLESDYDYVWRDWGQKGHRALLSPELKFPLLLGRYLEFEPSVRYTLNTQWFDNDQGHRDHQDLKTYEASAGISTTLDRIYDCEFLNAKRLKHRIRPTLSYTYQDFQDGEDQSPWFESIKEEGDANLVTLSIENFLDARLENEKGDVSYRQWANLTLSQGYDVREERREGGKKEPFVPLCAEMTLRPSPNLDFFGVTKWDHYDQGITFVDLSLDLTFDRSGDRKDTFNIDYLYEKDDQKSINFWLDVNLSYGLSVGSSLERDLGLDQDISNSHWLEYQRQCWGVKFVVEKEDEETSATIVFQLLGLGDINVH